MSSSAASTPIDAVGWQNYKRLRGYKRFRKWWTGLIDREPGLSSTGAGRARSTGKDEKSGMTGDCHVPFRGSPGVRFPRATRISPQLISALAS